jgi:hypothetical protein
MKSSEINLQVDRVFVFEEGEGLECLNASIMWGSFRG